MRGRPKERAAFMSFLGVLFQKLVTVMKHELVPVMKPDPWQRDEVVNVERRGLSRGLCPERSVLGRAWLRCCPCQRTWSYLVFGHGPSHLAGVVGWMPACPLFSRRGSSCKRSSCEIPVAWRGSSAWWGSHPLLARLAGSAERFGGNAGGSCATAGPGVVVWTCGPGKGHVPGVGPSP